MAFDITIMTKKIEGLKAAFESGRFADALVGSLNTGNGLMQQRIFQETQDIKGQPFGKYIGVKRKAGPIAPTPNRTQSKRNKAVVGQDLTPYERKRALKGRQIAKKDLEFSGGLRRAIETQIEGEKAAVLQFNTTLAGKIARGQEQQIANIRNGASGTTKGTGAVKIFSLNESEKEQVNEQGRELILQILKLK